MKSAVNHRREILWELYGIISSKTKPHVSLHQNQINPDQILWKPKVNQCRSLSGQIETRIAFGPA